MYSIDSQSGAITLPRGDTLLFQLRLTGASYPAGTAALFGLYARRRGTVFRKEFPLEEGTVNIYLTNAETRALGVGRYKWDVRIVTDPEYDGEGNLRCDDASDNVLSVFSGARGMPDFIVKEAAVDV